VWLCFVFFLLTTMAASVLQNFSSAILHNLYELPLTVATSALSAFLVGGACGIGVGGFLVGRGQGYDRVIVLSLATAAVTAGLLATGVASQAGVFVLMSVMGFGAGVAGPSRDMLVRQAATGALGSGAYGRLYGFVYSGLDVGFAIAPLAFGPLMDAGRFTEAIAGVAVLQTLAIFTALTVGATARGGATATAAAGSNR
jgi:MFS family permease